MPSEVDYANKPSVHEHLPDSTPNAKLPELSSSNSDMVNALPFLAHFPRSAFAHVCSSIGIYDELEVDLGHRDLWMDYYSNGWLC
jgi:hypothetical protein